MRSAVVLHSRIFFTWFCVECRFVVTNRERCHILIVGGGKPHPITTGRIWLWITASAVFLRITPFGWSSLPSCFWAAAITTAVVAAAADCHYRKKPLQHTCLKAGVLQNLPITARTIASQIKIFGMPLSRFCHSMIYELSVLFVLLLLKFHFGKQSKK